QVSANGMMEAAAIPPPPLVQDALRAHRDVGSLDHLVSSASAVASPFAGFLRSAPEKSPFVRFRVSRLNLTFPIPPPSGTHEPLEVTHVQGNPRSTEQR